MAMAAMASSCAIGARFPGACCRNFTRGRTSASAISVSGTETPEREAAVSDLLQWLRRRGALAFEQSVEVKRGTRGLGLVARKSISKGEEILSIPKSAWIDVDAVGRSEIGKMCEGFEPWVAVAVFLIHEKGNPRSEWNPYLQVLPQVLDSPFCWSDEELKELKGSQFLGYARGFKHYINQEFEKVMEKVIKKRSDIFNSSLFTLEAFTWAYGIIRSRTFPPLFGNTLALIPFADFVNHSFTLSTDESSWKPVTSGSEQFLSLRAAGDFKENEEVLMPYGRNKRNSQLALDYGFIDETGLNNRDSYTMILHLPTSDQSMDTKTELAEKNGLRSTSFFIIHRNEEPPEDMLAFLRLSALGGKDAVLLEDEYKDTVWELLKQPVSRDSETLICQSMIKGCRSTLSDYATTIEEDIKELESGNITARKKIALVIRLGEKQIVREQLQWFHSRLANFDRLQFHEDQKPLAPSSEPGFVNKKKKKQSRVSSG